MDQLVSVLQRIAPELSRVVEERYIILRNVRFIQPVGRRVLAAVLKEPERAVRRELDVLRAQGLVQADVGGVKLTPEGEGILDLLGDYLRHLRGLVELERMLADRFGLERAIVVPGDSDQDPSVKRELGRAAGRVLRDILRDGQILAVTGGTTIAEVANALSFGNWKVEVTVVPARGGLGEDVEKQANTIAALLAKTLGGSHRLLHVPDDLSEEALASVTSEPRIREVLELVRRADVVLHGVGTAEEMARRRGLSEEQISRLEKLGAVGEAFGYYFDRLGRPVYITSSVGLKLEDLERAGTVIAVGGGASKAEAVVAVMSHHYQDILVTDEGVARRIASEKAGQKQN